MLFPFLAFERYNSVALIVVDRLEHRFRDTLGTVYAYDAENVPI
jgi:hypothetical protein